MFDKLFNPKGVAIIGASQKTLSIGNVITKNLIKYEYKGGIYPINPKADEICGLKAYPSILDVPGSVDVAHMSIPAKFAPMAMDECGKKGVQFVIINSAGFKEVGPEGAALEKKTVEVAKNYGIRVFGPNCQGIINTDPEVKAYCDFTFTFPEPGYISIVAQSGGVGAVFMQNIHDLGVGMRFYASNGNACDISIPEILRYYGDDEKTRVIILYVEGFNNPKEFMDAAREVAAKKPILAMRAGRTKEGAKAAASHTGGMVGVGLSTELIFKKTGILTFQDQEEMCQSAMAFAEQPVPKGKRVGLITDTGGPAIIATDALVEAGVEIPPLSDKAVKILEEKLYPEASAHNPIDVLATGNAGHYRAALDVLMDEEHIDAVYINFVTPPFVDCESVAKEMAAVSKKRKKPIVCNYMTDKPQWTGTTAILKDGNIPLYDYAEMAAKVMAALTNYNELRSRELGEPKTFPDVDKAKAEKILQNGKDAGKKMLSAAQVYEILGCYGIPAADWRTAGDAAAAAEAAEETGFPVVLKADSEKIVHKSDEGGVALNLADAASVKAAAEEMEKKFGKEGLQFFIQKFMPGGGKETIIGAKAEPGLGHTLMFGLGGVYVELLKDVSFALTPVTPFESEEMISSIKTHKLLEGFRGDKGVDRKKLAEIIQRVSQLVTDLPGIEEMDLNPIIAYEDGAFAVDARIMI
ncbi:MAG: acetate--CoA ligase family protein [Candidatus Aminicenantes bacterium]|nr:acetate--CoA ligase family protein [Candidatus Aminicenantes bacterium]